ncbi:DUF6879 family protein [Streptomyces sp. ODS28]|uniref:DUF6879 family protein n=1 Tax=Streptomyces sp. ODS28 TaxID=3136688 RepID=UPI0031EA219A
MTLRFIGTTSGDGDCPTLYEVEETGDVVVQGERLTNPEDLARLRDVKNSETFVVVPRELLTRFAPRSDVPDLIPFTDAAHLFEEFEHTAWRLETRRGYASDRNSPHWERFWAGEDTTYELNPWRENVKAQTAQGKRFERVRIVDDPPSEGQRFLFARGLGNVAAGEDIRNLNRSEAERLALPDYDFWLFDSRVLMKLEIDDEDTTLGVRLIRDPEAVLAACQARDAAWHHAVRTEEFQRQVRSTA